MNISNHQADLFVQFNSLLYNKFANQSYIFQRKKKKEKKKNVRSKTKEKQIYFLVDLTDAAPVDDRLFQ